MTKRRFLRLSLLLLCLLLAAGLVGHRFRELHRTLPPSGQLLLQVDLPPAEGETVRVSAYGQQHQLMAEQLCIASQGKLLLHLHENEFSQLTAATAQRLDEESEAALGDPVPVTLTPYQGISPSELYEPGYIAQETISYKSLSIPIYREALPSRFVPGDFQWSETAPDRLQYTGKDFTARFGIDVSAHQNQAGRGGALDWDAAAGDGVDFVMLRAGLRGYKTGQLREDAFFRENLKGAQEAGLPTGVYFFSQAVTAEEALEEADFLLKILREENYQGVVAYDWESDPDYRVNGTSPEMATACAVAFCQRVEEAGHTAVIYASRHTGYTLYDQAALAGFGLWYPQYPGAETPAPVPDFYYQPDCWQFSDRCTVAGIPGPVDGNLLFLPK